MKVRFLKKDSDNIIFECELPLVPSKGDFVDLPGVNQIGDPKMFRYMVSFVIWHTTHVPMIKPFPFTWPPKTSDPSVSVIVSQY